MRDLEASNGPALLALNNHFPDEIGLATEAEMAALCAMALAVRVAERDEALAGALILVPSGAASKSANFAWFTSASAEPFAYIDRVMVAPGAHGQGLGRALYDDAARIAHTAGLPRLVCEVNERPPNPVSLAFHEAMGFTPLASFENPQSGKKVRVLEKRL